MSTPGSFSEKNAFALLMSKRATKTVTTRLSQTPSVGTTFVVCPAGCGKRMLEKDVNQHLDQCVRLQQSYVEDISQAATQYQPEDIVSQEPLSMADSQPCTQLSSVMQYAASNRLSSKKRRRVVCPSCQNSFPSALINLHLDQCIKRTSSKTNPLKSPQLRKQGIDGKSSPAELDIPLTNVLTNPLSSSETEDHLTVMDGDTNDANDTPLYDAHDEDYNDTTAIVSIHETKPQSSVDATPKFAPHSQKLNSAFTTMMEQSKAISRKKDKSKPPIHMMFHMDESLRVRLSSPMTVETEWTPPVWSILMNIRDKYSKIPDLENPTQSSSIKIEVTVSTDVPSYINQPIRWVRQHSQLSPPVLKSILQKSIRRRKPLPAVRVAMELADKALGELLRRLPVIMLEDSYLHPDINLLVWTMMAHTKDYQPSSKVMIRIFQIIYEIAACQWSDPLPRNDSEHLVQTVSVSLTSLFKGEGDGVDPTNARDSELALSSSAIHESTTYIWAMLVRAEYGGLKCDIQMLHRYAKMWLDRFTTGQTQNNVPDDTIQLLYGKINPNTETSNESFQMKWSNLPTYVHEKVREQGLARVASLCNHGIDRLVVEDLCVEGIDYHCSGIINALISDESVSGICYDLMTLAESSSSPQSSESQSTTNDCRRTDLENILKVVIWHFSSKVNYRRPLSIGNPSSRTPEVTSSDSYIQYTELWNDLIAPRALHYQRDYVHQRMVR